MAVDRRQQTTAGTTAASASNAATSASSATNAAASSSGSVVTTASGASTTAHYGITGGPGYNPNATSVSIAANGNPGQIVMTQPPLHSTSYYKIADGQSVTFGWNFTNLAITPTALTVSAACENGNTYPVGPSNGVIDGGAQSVVWDLGSYQANHPSLPLAQAKYTLLIFADGGPSAAPTPGYLEPNSACQFALYTPQPYTPLASGWQCAGCGGALEQFKAHPASIALLTTLLVVFLSGFTTLRRVWD